VPCTNVLRRRSLNMETEIILNFHDVIAHDTYAIFKTFSTIFSKKHCEVAGVTVTIVRLSLVLVRREGSAIKEKLCVTAVDVRSIFATYALASSPDKIIDESLSSGQQQALRPQPSYEEDLHGYRCSNSHVDYIYQLLARKLKSRSEGRRSTTFSSSRKSKRHRFGSSAAGFNRVWELCCLRRAQRIRVFSVTQTRATPLHRDSCYY
jgi:hypothetical protein